MTGTTAEIISMAYNPIWYARSNSVLTMNFLKNKIIRKAIIGEISKPLLLMLVGILLPEWFQVLYPKDDEGRMPVTGTFTIKFKVI